MTATLVLLAILSTPLAQRGIGYLVTRRIERRMERNADALAAALVADILAARRAGRPY